MKKILLTLTLLIVASTAIYAKKTCSQFKNYKEANAYFKAKKSGYKSLDRNHDGKPCEALWKNHLAKKNKAQELESISMVVLLVMGKVFHPCMLVNKQG